MRRTNRQIQPYAINVVEYCEVSFGQPNAVAFSMLIISAFLAFSHRKHILTTFSFRG